MGITEYLVALIVGWIAQGGYPAIFLLMISESTVLPTPSEAVMPFAGYLVISGELNFWSALIVSTAGSIIGSLISYCIGIYGGVPLVRKWGKYFLVHGHHLEQTEKFFKKHGDKTIFISRFIPVVRHFISLPAGVGRMPIIKFIVFTALGAGMWNAILLKVGMFLGQNWKTLETYGKLADYIVLAVILILIARFVLNRKSHKHIA